MRKQRKIARLCQQAAMGRYAAPNEEIQTGAGILLAPGQPVPAGYSLVITLAQN